MLKAQVIILALAVFSPRGPVRQLISSFTFKLEPPVTRYCPMLYIYIYAYIMYAVIVEEKVKGH